MSLKAFHIFFIVMSALMCFGIASWRLSYYMQTGGLGPMAQASASAVAGLVLVGYGLRFLRKYKELEYL